MEKPKIVSRVLEKKFKGKEGEVDMEGVERKMDAFLMREILPVGINRAEREEIVAKAKPSMKITPLSEMDYKNMRKEIG